MISQNTSLRLMDVIKVLTGRKCEGCEFVFILEIHQGCSVGFPQSQTGNADQSGGSIGAAKLVISHPRNVHWIVLLKT